MRFSQWHSHSWLCVSYFLGLCGTGIPACANFPSKENLPVEILERWLTMDELSSGLGIGLGQHSQEWLCHQNHQNQMGAQEKDEGGTTLKQAIRTRAEGFEEAAL